MHQVRTGPPGRVPRGMAAALATLVWAVVAVAVVASPAGAHAELVSSSPKDGQTLTTAPAELQFTFGEDLLTTGHGITLTVVATGERLEVGRPQVDGDTVSAAWPERSPAGRFEAAYRVVSADGHPIDGVVTFEVSAPQGDATSATATASASASTLPMASPDPVSAVPVPASAESQPEAGVLAWVLGLGVVALVAALAATWVTRRRGTSG